MSDYRNMRLLLMFDLPMVESYEKRAYTDFHKALSKHGYYMLQYSVYVKSVNTQTKVEQEIKKIKPYVPLKGNIRIIAITEKQYIGMAVLLGKKSVNEIYNGPERYIKI